MVAVPGPGPRGVPGGEEAAGVLAGRRVVVTRARPGRLDDALRSRGAHVLSMPVIAFVAPDDGGRGLRHAAGALGDGRYDWVVLTSATAVAHLADGLGDPAVLAATPVAAIGPATADAVVQAGGTVEVIPPRAVGEALVEAFPTGDGTVLQIRPAETRDVVAEGLRAKGWRVDEVTAYRTVPVTPHRAVLDAVAAADLITFTSPSTVTNVLAVVDPTRLPAAVVAIGPVTAAALQDRGVTVTTQADPHTVDGLVDAVVRTLAG